VVVVIVVIVIVIMVMVVSVVAVAALTPRFFELFAALVRLSTAFAVTLHGIAQSFFRLVNASFALAVSVVRPRRKGRAHQAGDRQQCNAQNPDFSGHIFSLSLEIEF
jgi:hypothetical protein